MTLSIRIPHLIYGGDYNPDQWPEDVWLEDARLMREAGVNLVSLAIFSWAKLEPSDGVYDFDWLDRLMGLLHEHGVSVNLATPTASPPPWLVKLHPDLLPVTAEGVTLWHGARRHYCPHNPSYRLHAARIATQLAERYKNHPALALWHVDNEYACHINACYCDTSAAAFRTWLQARYEAIEKLNEAWGTAFWSQRYNDWDEIQPPRTAPSFPNPTQQLDWRRFSSDSWLDCFEEQKTILHQITPEVPVTTNFMGFHKAVDYWKWAAQEDVVANDNYPDTSDPHWNVEAGMICDLMRSLGNHRPWILMEQAPTHVNWRPRNPTKRPGLMRLGSYQAVARGADGIMFFQWRASKAGAEKFHSGMVPHAGLETRVWREIKSLGNELSQLDVLRDSRVQADVAILFDWESWWALETDGKPSSLVRQMPQVLAWYQTLFARHITVDFAHPEADLSRYKLVIAPTLYLVNDRAAGNINQYVSNGGTLIMSFFSGIVNERDHIRLGGYPASFKQMLGLSVEEFDPYPETQSNLIHTVDGNQFACTLWSDVIHLEGAEAIATYQHDYYADCAAITRNTFGKGRSFYAGTLPNAQGIAWLLEQACNEAGVQPVLSKPTEGVEVVRRTNGRQSWLFVLNHCNKKVEIPLEKSGLDLLTQKMITGSLGLDPAGVAILQQ